MHVVSTFTASFSSLAYILKSHTVDFSITYLTYLTYLTPTKSLLLPFLLSYLILPQRIKKNKEEERRRKKKKEEERRRKKKKE